MEMPKELIADEDFDMMDYELMKQAARENDLKRYIQIRQLYLLKEIREAIREQSEL